MIKLEKVNKTYRCGGAEVKAVQELNLEIRRGEFVSIVGPSGSGKSTLLNIIGCLDRPDSGKYFFDGSDIEGLSDDELAVIRGFKIGFVFQFFNLFPRVSVIRNLMLPMIFAGMGTRKHRIRSAMKMLYEVGVPERAKFAATDISGGEQQKVAIARALMNRPDLLLADEPTGNLDSKSSEKIMSILGELNQRGMTIIMVTHNEELARATRRIVSIHDGRMIGDEAVG